MRFGVQVGNMFTAGAGSIATSSALRLARAARDAGFDGLFAGHHYLARPSNTMLDPLMLLSYLAAECPGMHLAATTYLLPLHTDLVPVAEMVASLDQLCG